MPLTYGSKLKLVEYITNYSLQLHKYHKNLKLEEEIQKTYLAQFLQILGKRLRINT